jgi:iron complex outermembrane receptor protein
LYIDDVPYADAYSFPSELLKVESLAIHRGPQGTMYGRNAPAGLIEMYTARPGNVTRGSGGVEFGSYDYFGARAALSGPLGGDFSHSFQLYYNRRDGFVRNSFLGRETDDREVVGGIASLFWNPRPDFEMQLRIAAEQSDDGSQRLTSLFSPDPFKVNSNIPGETDIERFQISLHGTKDFEWGQLKSITAWQTWELDPSIVDLDLTPIPDLESSSFVKQDLEYLTQEFRLESHPDSDLWWRTGLFLANKQSDGDAVRMFPFMGFPISERTLYDIEEDNVALYGTARWNATARWTLEAGGRLEYVDSSIDRTKSTMAGFPVPTAEFKDSDDEIYFSPTAGVSYAIDHAWTAFARTGLGIKPHGFSGFGGEGTSAYDDERSWSNEIGVAYDCPDQGLTFSLRGFWNAIDDYQLNRGLQDVGSTDFIIVNADEVTARGIEAEARWRPIDNLTLHASVGYTDAEFDDYTDSFTGTDFDGNNVPYIPEFSAGGGFRYDFAGGFFVQSSLRATGTTYFDDANSSVFSQKDYYVWDAEVGYQNETVRVAVYGRNLLDEEYYTFINDQVFAGTPGDPQLFGVRVDLAF